MGRGEVIGVRVFERNSQEVSLEAKAKEFVDRMSKWSSSVKWWVLKA